MRVKKNLKQSEVSVTVDSLEDLWYLSQVIDEGDVVSGRTLRKVQVSDVAVDRRWVFLSVRVEKVDFSKSSSSLRVGGSIVAGPDDVPRGSHHSFSVEVGSQLSIKKERWLSFQLDRIDEAVSSQRVKVLVCVFDREEALFALMSRSGFDVLSRLKGEVEAKRVERRVKVPFFEELSKALSDYDSRLKLDHIVAASAAFWKDELLKVVKPDVRRKLITATCSSVDEAGVDEALRREEVKSALQKDRVLKEISFVEEVMSRIAKDGAVVYGLSRVSFAASAGAIECVLVVDSLISRLRSEGKFAILDEVLRLVDSQKGRIVVVSSDHDGGKKLSGIGGVAALLRYKL